MRHMKRIISALLVVLIVIVGMPFSVFAASENTPKEEVVYINLDADGLVKEINVVNIFELDENGQIIDYGKYEKLRNMTTTDKIGYVGTTVTIDTKAGKLYYEGKLDSNVMPWNIAIRYYMDDKEYSASEIAGKSGNLKITIKITENTECVGNFFEGYALQASVTLDTKKCSNIHADGATVANVGSDKQLTYTILPNKGADIEITANVTDFEMSGIAINGLKLNLDIEIDDVEIQSKVDEIISAVNDLDEGAGELNAGAGELYDGTLLLEDKVSELYTGVGALNSGTAELSSGLSAIASENQELLAGAYVAFEGLCSASGTILNAELTKDGLQPVTLTPENYAIVLNELLMAMGGNSASTGIAEIKGQLDNYSLFYEGLKNYTSAVGNAANGANTLKMNMDTLYSNVGTLKTSVGELNDGAKDLLDGTSDLKDGTSEFINETDGIETEVGSEIDAMIASAAGSDVEIISFVSEKNTNVDAVQFVIQSEAIEIEETIDAEPVVEEKLNFWQKLLRLFGLY